FTTLAWRHALAYARERHTGVRSTPLSKERTKANLHLHGSGSLSPIQTVSPILITAATPRLQIPAQGVPALRCTAAAEKHLVISSTRRVRLRQHLRSSIEAGVDMDGQQGNAGGASGGGNSGGVGSDYETVARAFVEYYYHTFDASRAGLAGLYGATSMLSFEGQRFAGAEEIGRKLAQLPFEQCRHSVTTVDCQPSLSFPGSILIFVSGNLQLAGEEHQLRFSQMFQLVPTEQGSFFVQNDIFRLNYG
ncbi:hypothetical protein EJB05_16714, partial [Eragrostis curvula]